MGISVSEQETVIQISRDSDVANVWTSDTTMMTKLDKIAEDPDSDWKLKDIGTRDGDILSKEYTCPKGLISFRKKKKEMSEEQRIAAGERMRKNIHGAVDTE